MYFCEFPLPASHVAQPGNHEHERRVPVGKVAHNPSAAAHIPHHLFHRVIRADFAPVLSRKICVGQSFGDTFFNSTCRGLELHRVHLIDHQPSFLQRRLAVPLGVIRFEHGSYFFHFCLGHICEDVAIEMHCTPQPQRFWVELAQRLHQVRDEKPYPLQAALLEAAQEGAPPAFVFFNPFRGTQNLAKTLLLDAKCDENQDITDLFGPGPLQNDCAKVDIQELAFQLAVAPQRYLLVDLFVQFGDLACGSPRAPQCEPTLAV